MCKDCEQVVWGCTCTIVGEDWGGASENVWAQVLRTFSLNEIGMSFLTKFKLYGQKVSQIQTKVLSRDIQGVARSSSWTTILTETITSENKYKSRDLGFSLYWITKAKAKENLRDFNLFRKRGLLLWLVRAQHDHCESKCERKSGGIYLPFHYESECENKSPDFYL